MLLPYSHGHDYYMPFYLLATLTNVLLLLVEGWRRGFPLRPWLALVAASSLALILGSKLVTHPAGEWAAALFRPGWPDTGRSVLGGALAATLTAVALRRWLGLGWAVLDALALPLCGALVVQCMGCLLTGCCFGVPTTGTWGLTYAAGTLPWLAQVQAGLLPATAAHSLPVAPTQLMALALCAAVGGVLLATRRRRWPVGSWLLLQTGLLLLGRFGQAFWRDAAGEPVAGDVYPGLGGHWLTLQVGLLPLRLLALGIWGWRVRRSATIATTLPISPVAIVGQERTLTVVLAMLVLTAVLGFQVLTPPEVVAMRSLLLLVVVVECYAGLSSLYVRGPRLAGLPLRLVWAAVFFVGTAQAPAPQKVVPDSTRPRYSVLLSGGTLGNYHEDEQNIQTGNSGSSGCTGSQRLAMQQRVRASGGEVALSRVSATGKTYTIGAGAWVGEQQIDLQIRPQNNSTYYPITNRDTSITRPLSDYHFYWEESFPTETFDINFRAGLHVGNLGSFSYWGENNDSQFPNNFAPELMVRVGDKKGFFGQLDAGYGAENALGSYAFRTSLGLNLRDVRSRVMGGVAFSTHKPTPYLGFVSAQLFLPGATGLGIEPHFATDLGQHNRFSLKLNYWFGQ